MASGYAAESAEGREPTVGNLQPQLTRLIGREAALRELSALLWHTRLLTLAGPGGAGKTRLAVAVAEATQADFIGGAWWVDLSATMDSELVGPAVVRAVLPGEQASEVPSVTIARHLADTSLLVLDNCEQVVEGCAEFVRALLARNQATRVIATSRQPLGVPGEQVWRVQGLAVTRPGGSPPTGSDADAGEEGSAELFVERVREVAASFDPEGPGCREAIARICAQLDGLPLALELAAARVPLLGIEQIAERLEHGHEFLRHASRSVPERQRTLAQTVEWSHRLLDAARADAVSSPGRVPGQLLAGRRRARVRRRDPVRRRRARRPRRARAPVARAGARGPGQPALSPARRRCAATPPPSSPTAASGERHPPTPRR